MRLPTPQIPLGRAAISPAAIRAAASRLDGRPRERCIACGGPLGSDSVPVAGRPCHRKCALYTRRGERPAP